MRLKSALITCFVGFATVFSCFASSTESQAIISRAIKPQISLNDKGYAAAVWENFSQEIFVSIRNEDEYWTEELVIGQGEKPKISIDSLGNAVAVWIYNQSFLASVYQTDHYEWSTPATIVNSPVNIKSLKLAGNSKGMFAAIWIEDHSEETSTVFLATLPDIQSEWTAPEQLSEEHHESIHPDLAISSSGEILTVWEENQGAITAIKYSNYSQKNGWSSASQVSSSDRNAILPSAAIDSQGNGIIIWVRNSLGTKAVVEAAMLPTDGSWMRPIDLGYTNLSSPPKLVMNGEGYAVATWSAIDELSLRASTVKFGQKWTGVKTIHGSLAYLYDLTMNEKGSALVVWMDLVHMEDCNYNSIEASVLPYKGKWTRLPQIMKLKGINLDCSEGKKVYYPQVKLNKFNQAVAIWGTTESPFMQTTSFPVLHSGF